MVFIIKDSGIDSQALKIAHKEIVPKRSIKASGKTITLYSIVNDNDVSVLSMFDVVTSNGGVK